MSLRQNLIDFIEERQGVVVAAGDSLFERGLLDSMALVELLAFIEENTGVRVPDSAIEPENFETVERIEKLVTRLRQP
jgi:acyl carrier protein